MRTSQLIYLLLFLSAWTTSCFPTKPLNERSTELTWQAWLLIDESQNKQQDSTLRRRITPKSVFIAPTFSPENLPACSEGYQSDSMGRCIKIIMLNKELHLDFLLQQLNQKFGGIEDYEDEEGTTAGPLNINIPLDAEEDSDIAIVVAPTNGVLQSESNMQMLLNKTFNEEKVNVGDIAGILGLKQAEEVETTTLTGTSTSDSSTLESTTKNFETTTLNTGGATSQFDALFFLDPKRQVEVKTDHYDDFTTLHSTILDSEATESIKLTTEIKRETTDISSGSNTEAPLYQMDQALPSLDAKISFSDTKREAIKPVKFWQNEAQTTESILTNFTAKTVSAMPETKFNNIYLKASPSESTSQPFKKVEDSQTTIAPILLTPIDNALSNREFTHTTPFTPSTTSSIFSIGFQKHNHDTLYNDNSMKFFSRFGEPAKDSSEAPESITEVITTTEDIASTTKGIYTTVTEIERSTTELPKSSIPSVKLSNSSQQKNFEYSVQTSQFIRFSTTEEASTNVDHTLDASHQLETIFNQYVPTRGADLTENQRHIFKNPQVVTPFHADIPQSIYQRYKAHRDNHRNREKHGEWFHLPPKWSDTSHKPVVLRFSRKHGYIDTQQLGSNNFYREINPRLFGFPAKSRVHR